MNHSWGYTVKDVDYLDSKDLIQTLVRTAAKGANLLLNIGPQPDGRLPQAALDRLNDIGEWMETYSTTIRPTTAAGFAEQPWGVATQREDTLFIHILDAQVKNVEVPIGHKTIRAAKIFSTGEKVGFKPAGKGNTRLEIGEIPADIPDYVIQLTLK